MTDLPFGDAGVEHLPSRLGSRFRLDGGHLVGVLEVVPALRPRGTVAMSSLVFLVDAVAGVSIDTDPTAWAFTSELSVRAPLDPAVRTIECRPLTLRDGRRSATCDAPLVSAAGPWGSGFAGFSRVPRRDGDPPKTAFDPQTAVERIKGPPIEVPLREAAGYESLDPATGAVRVALRPELLNPAGTLQGALVAGLAEAAAEDLADHHRALGVGRHVVTEMEIRYLAQNRTSPIAARAWFAGPPAEGLVRVDLVDDDGRGRLTTAVMARVRPAPADA